MKAVALLLLLLAGTAAADPLTVADMRVEIPQGWAEEAQLAELAARALVSGGLTGGAKVFAKDPAFVLIGWVSAKKKKGGTVRLELESLHAALKEQIQEGAQVVRYDVTETANRITVGYELDREGQHLVGTLVAAVQKGGTVRGWMVACGYSETMESRARVPCEQVVGTLRVLVPDAELLPLEKKAK